MEHRSYMIYTNEVDHLLRFVPKVTAPTSQPLLCSRRISGLLTCRQTDQSRGLPGNKGHNCDGIILPRAAQR